MTTFKAPLRVYDVSKDTNSDAGDVVITQTASLVFGDTSVNVCRLPPNSQILEIYVDVTTAFNSGTSNDVDLGVTGALTQFADGLDVSSTGRLRGTSDVSQLTNYQDIGTSGITLIATHNAAGTAATTGAAEITVSYAARTELRT